MCKIENSIVLITGGTGTFGSEFVDYCIKKKAAEVRVFSRDEKKQYDLSQKYSDVNSLKFYIGDVRDASSLELAMKGVDFVFHAAAMKQVPSCECFPYEAIKTNCIGSENVLNCAIANGVKKVVCLSSDKAVSPSSAMGMTKSLMEKIAIQKSKTQNKTKVCITRFGNLLASRGSVVPLFLEKIIRKQPITITDENMTRFIMTVQEAIELVGKAFDIGESGQILIKRSKACSVGKIVSAVCSYAGVKNYPVKIIGARSGEKMSESLFSKEEASHVILKDDFFIVDTKNEFVLKNQSEYNSDDCDEISEEELVEMIKASFNE